MPAKRVKFRHPDTGEDTDGHIHGTPGRLGATIVDGRGQLHKVPHGDYLHHREPSQEGDKPDAAQVAQVAQRHLELGPKAPMAVHAACALLAVGGAKRPHGLRVGDVGFEGEYALIHPDRLRTDDASVVAFLRELAKGKDPSSPLFVVDGEPLSEDGMTAYVNRFGRQNATVGGKDQPPDQPPDQPMAKAAAVAFLQPELEPVVDRWTEQGMVCEFRKGRHGIGALTITQPGRVPLHEAVVNAMAARALARQLASDIRAGRAPRRGVYRVI